MAGDSLGEAFRVTSWGESHGKAIGIVVEGCPPRLKLDEKQIQGDLDRRRPGQSKLTTARAEKDQVKILSGVDRGLTLGSPISLLIPNEDARPRDYDSDVYRPSHADFTYDSK